MSLNPGEIIVPPYEEWRSRAVCLDGQISIADDPDPFFSDDRKIRKEAIRVCQRECPVKNECLRYALAWGEESGIWGGMTRAQRHKIARDYHGTPEHWQLGCRCPDCKAAQRRRREVASFNAV